MIFKVYLMRRGGRRLTPVEVINGQGYVGDLRTTTGQCKELTYQVAELVSVGPASSRLLAPLYEPVLTSISTQTLVLRGFERMREPEGYYSVIQEWRCETSK